MLRLHHNKWRFVSYVYLILRPTAIVLWGSLVGGEASGCPDSLSKLSERQNPSGRKTLYLRFRGK